MDATVLRVRGDRALVAGHLVLGPGPARVVSSRAVTAEADAPEESGHARVWRNRDRPGTAPRGGGLALVGSAVGASGGIDHGVNSAGILVAGDQAPDADRAPIGELVRRVLEQAGSLDAAIALAAAGLREARLARARVELAAAGGAATLTLSGREVTVAERTPPAAQGSTAGWRSSLLGRQVAAPLAGEPPVAAALAARLGGDGVEILLCVGPPHCGVHIRHWPGIDVAPQTRGLAELSARLAAAAAGRPALLAGIATALAPVRAAVLDEGDEAERLAAIMDRDGDDRGAEVRRGVAQLHALTLARDALRRLLAGVEAPAAARAATGPDL